VNSDIVGSLGSLGEIKHSKKCWVVLTQFWVKYGQTQPLGYILNCIFNPMIEFFPYLTQNWVKTTQHFLE